MCQKQDQSFITVGQQLTYMLHDINNNGWFMSTYVEELQKMEFSKKGQCT
jgi:hypothetical protein